LGGIATQAFDLRCQGIRVKPEFISPYLKYRKWRGKDDKQNEQDEKFSILSIRGAHADVPLAVDPLPIRIFKIRQHSSSRTALWSLK
jgi:hypothetical protein